MSSTSAFDLEQAQFIQGILVKPMVDAVEAKIENMLKPLVDAVAAYPSRFAAIEGRATNLEGSQKKALVGWGAFATVAAGGMSYAWGWIKSHFHVS